MAVINPDVFDATSNGDEQFWEILQLTLMDVFRVDPSIARRYRDSLAEASNLERLLVIHDEPIDVAASLANIKITDAHSVRYNTLVAEVERTRTWFQSGYPETRAPVTLEALDRVFGELGYMRQTESDESLLFHKWKRSDNLEVDAPYMPMLLMLRVPQFWAKGHSELLYDWDYVFQMLTGSFARTSTGERMRSIFLDALLRAVDPDPPLPDPV
jgi:hypothetical protein